MKIRRKLAGMSAAAIVLSSMTVPVSFAAGSFADTGGHWGESSITRWSDYGIVQGVDGTHFRPDNSMTRAQMATILANLLGLESKIENPFSDVQSGAWYEDAVLKCAAAGIMKGTSDTTADPNSTITREQASVMLARSLGIADGNGSSDFADAGQISDWAAGAVKAMADLGIVNGVGNNNFVPKANITRASVAAILDRSIAAYANKSGASLEASDSGITLIAAPGVTVTGSAKDMIVAPGAKGVTTLEDATVSGALTMQAADGTLELSGTTTVTDINVPQGTDAATITIKAKANVGTLSTAAAETKVNIEGKADKVNIAGSATNSTVAVAKDAAVGTLTSAADNVQVTGDGKLSGIVVSDGKGVTVAGSVSVENITNNSADSVSHGDKVVAGKTPSASTDKPVGGGSSGGGGSGSGGGGGNNPATASATAETITALTSKAAELNGVSSTLDVEADPAKRSIASDASVVLTADKVPSDGTLTINLRDQSLGDVTINAVNAKGIIINGDEGTLLKNLTVNAPKATVEQNVTVSGIVTVLDVSDKTFKMNKPVGSLKAMLQKAAKIQIGARLKPNITVMTSENVTIEGGANITVKQDDAKVTLSGSENATITGDAAGAKINVQSSGAVTLQGDINEVTNTGSPNLTIDTGTVSKLTNSKPNSTIGGKGTVKELEIKAAATVNANAGTVTVPNDAVTGTSVTLNGAVGKVDNKKSGTNISGSGVITEIKTTDNVTVNNGNVQKVSVPEGAGNNITITAGTDVNIPLIETEKSQLTIAGEGKVTTVDVADNAGASVAITAENGKVASVAIVGNTSVEVKTSSGAATTGVAKAVKESMPSGVDGTNPTTSAATVAGQSGTITVTPASGQTNAAYEYAQSISAKDWTPMSGTSATVQPGTYFVRTKGTNGTLPSTPAFVEILPILHEVKITDAEGKEITGAVTVGTVLKAAAVPVEAVATYRWSSGSTSATLTVTDSMIPSVNASVTVTGVAGDTKPSTRTLTVKADTTALDNALAAAETYYVSHTVENATIVVSSSAADVDAYKQFVSESVSTTFKNAYDAGKNISATANIAEVTRLTANLISATNVFKDSLQYGTKVNETVFNAAVEAARKNLNSVVHDKTSANDVPPSRQWVTADVWNTYSQTITSAQATTEGMKALNDATAVFDNAKKSGAPVDFTALNAAITSAKSTIGFVSTSTEDKSYEVLPNVMWATQETKTAYQTEIDNAEKAAKDENNTACVNSVAAELTNLNNATSAFTENCKPGTKDIIAPVLSDINVEWTNGGTTAAITYTSSEAGTYSYSVVKAGSSDEPITGNGNVTVGRNTISVPVNNVTAGAEYTFTVTVSDTPQYEGATPNVSSFQRTLVSTDLGFAIINVSARRRIDQHVEESVIKFTSTRDGKYWIGIGREPDTEFPEGVEIKKDVPVELNGDLFPYWHGGEDETVYILVVDKDGNRATASTEIETYIPEGSYAVTYHMNNHIHSTPVELVEAGKTITKYTDLYSFLFETEGRFFTGWKKGTEDADGNVTLDEEMFDVSTPINANIDLYAQYDSLLATTEAELFASVKRLKDADRPGRVPIGADITLTSALELPPNISFSVKEGCTFTIAETGSLTVLSWSSSVDGTIINNGKMHIASGRITLCWTESPEQGGTLTNNGSIIVSGTTDNYGETGDLDVGNGGTLLNNGSITCEDYGSVRGGNITISKTGTVTCIGTGGFGGNITTVNGKVTISSKSRSGAGNLIIGNGGVVTVEQDAEHNRGRLGVRGELTIKNGGQLINNGELWQDFLGSLTIEEGGKLTNTGNVELEGGTGEDRIAANISGTLVNEGIIRADNTDMNVGESGVLESHQIYIGETSTLNVLGTLKMIGENSSFYIDGTMVIGSENKKVDVDFSGITDKTEMIFDGNVTVYGDLDGRFTLGIADRTGINNQVVINGNINCTYDDPDNFDTNLLIEAADLTVTGDVTFNSPVTICGYSSNPEGIASVIIGGNLTLNKGALLVSDRSTLSVTGTLAVPAGSGSAVDEGCAVSVGSLTNEGAITGTLTVNGKEQTFGENPGGGSNENP